MAYKLDTSSLLLNEKKTTSNFFRVLLYYERAVDSTILVDLVSITYNQFKSTEANTQSITQLLDYCDTHINDIICYK